MSSFDPQASYPTPLPEVEDAPPPRPTTPPLRRGFVWVLMLLSVTASMVYGIPYMLEQSGYAYEKGRARASSEALEKLDQSGALAKASELFRMATQAVSPAVVHIQTQTYVKGGIAGNSLGSGVVVDKEHGYIVTNNHVIRGADLITVRVGRRTEMTAELVGADAKTDLAVIRVKGNLPQAAEWGDSNRLEPGEWVLAIGSPFGLERTVSAGIVSATARGNLRMEVQDAYDDFIQTDVAINPGNSGGPLIDLRGRIVGINTAISLLPEKDGGNQGIGFAISADLAHRVVDQLIKSGKVVRGYLGIISQPMTPDQAKLLNLPDANGALIALILPNSPALKAGLKPDDVILAIDGKPIEGPSTLRNTAFTLPAGTVVPIKFMRAGKTQELAVTVAEMPLDPSLAYFGFNVKDGTPEPAGTTEVDQVSDGGPAAKVGVKPGQRILWVGRRRIYSKAEFDVAIGPFAGMGSLPLGIVREGKLDAINVGLTSP